MPRQPVLAAGARFRLRPFRLADAPAVQHLAGHPDIADTTQNVPHPYEDGMAEAWIRTHRPHWTRGQDATYAVCRAADGELVGCVHLRIDQANRGAELGYWVGRPFWGQGIATAAARRLVEFGFAGLGLHRVYAHHLSRNPASGRVMHKIGMRHEGHLRGHVFRNGRFEDLELYGLLATDPLPEANE